MKNYVWMVLVLAGLMMVGCGGSNEVDTSSMEKSMATADPTVKGDSDKAVAAIKKGDLSGAMASLTSLASQAKLTPEQKQAVTDVINQVKKQLEAAAAKVAEEGSKAVEDGKKALEGIVPQK